MIEEQAILDVVASLDEPSTGAIAAQLGIAPRTPMRDSLNESLMTLRKRRKLAFEPDPESGVFRWRLYGQDSNLI